MSEERSYDVQEANAMLPELRERLARIRDARQAILREAEVVRERVVADGGGSHAGREYWDASATLPETGASSIGASTRRRRALRTSCWPASTKQSRSC